jgi:hypothetical protein
MAFYYRTRTTQPAGPVAGVFILLLGFALLAGSWHFGQQTRELLSQGIHVQGEIIEIKEEWKTTTERRQGYPSRQVEKVSYHPVVFFRDKANNEVRFRDAAGSNYPNFQKGQKVEVIYLEKDPPGTATIDHGMMNWMVPGILALLGVASLLGGGAAIARGRGVAV